jgi:hypothetical protein
VEFQVVLDVMQNLHFLKTFAQEMKKTFVIYYLAPSSSFFLIMFVPYSHLRLEKLEESGMEEFQIAFSFLSVIQEDVSEIALAGTLPALSFLSGTCSVTQIFLSSGQ